MAIIATTTGRYSWPDRRLRLCLQDISRSRSEVGSMRRLGRPWVPAIIRARRVQETAALRNFSPSMSAWGLVSRVAPVQTAVRNCTRDEGRPFGFGDYVADPKPPRAAAVKSRGGERRGNAGTMIPAGMVERGERKRTASEASKAD